MPASDSSIGSMISRSTLSGDAPGSGTIMTTMGAGPREFVCVQLRERHGPKTTRANIGRP
jgi:hypothetical protein